MLGSMELSVSSFLVVFLVLATRLYPNDETVERKIIFCAMFMRVAVLPFESFKYFVCCCFFWGRFSCAYFIGFQRVIFNLLKKI